VVFATLGDSMRREGSPLPEKIGELQIYPGIIEITVIALENNEKRYLARLFSGKL
jgi:hypothetical protein